MSPPAPALRRLLREIHELQTNPPEGIRVIPSEVDVCEVDAWIRGPEGTPYASGYFKLHFSFPSTYPSTPPSATFLTKIFHPNVGPTGAICVNTLKKDWTPSLGITHVLVSVKCLLIHPNPESALDEEAGRLIMEGWDAFDARARLLTGVHARVKPSCFEWVAPSEKEDSKEKKEVVASMDAVGKGGSENAPASPSIKSTTTPSTTTERVTAPLGTADANIVGSVPTSNSTGAVNVGTAQGGEVEKKAAMKRAAAGSSGADKRKKALKRL